MSEPAPKSPKIENDDDLDDLLDEFDEQVLSKPPGAEKPQESQPQNDEFKHNIDDLVKDLNIEDPEARAQLETLVKQFEDVHLPEAKKAGFQDVVGETMQRLKNSEKKVDEQLQNDSAAANPEDMLTQLLAGLGDGGGNGDFDMSKLLTDMLEQLSSKDVLYEPIKDLHTKFPDYLKDNKEKLSPEDHAKYTKQYEVTKEIVAVFESPTFDNENLEHRDQINTLLESLQELGNPPTELVGDEKDFPGFGGGGMDFGAQDLPKDFEKDLEEGCKQT